MDWRLLAMPALGLLASVGLFWTYLRLKKAWAVELVLGQLEGEAGNAALEPEVLRRMAQVRPRAPV